MLLFTLAQTNHKAIVTYDAKQGVSFNCKILVFIQGSYFSLNDNVTPEIWRCRHPGRYF
jgi:hypothetical protein